MCRTIILSLLVAIITSASSAQFRKGDVEVSFSASGGSRSMKISYLSFNVNESENYNFLYTGLCCGYFVTRGLSVETEIALSAIEKQFPAWFLLGNLSYTLAIDSARVAPFIRAGYGVSNGILPFPGALVVVRLNDKMKVKVLNIGGGIKYRIAGPVYLRTEINYKHYIWSEEQPPYYLYPPSAPYSVAYSYGDFGLLLGLSVVI